MQRRLWLVLSLTLMACGGRNLIAGVDDSDGGVAGSSSGGSGASSGSSGGGSTTIPAGCPALASGAIPGLVTGQSATSGGTATLRFSNQAFACGDWLTSTNGTGCQEPWAYTLSFPAGDLQPGVYDLVGISAQFGELFQVATPTGNGSCDYASDGIGSDTVSDVSSTGGTLEIDSSGPGCITGRISGLSDFFESSPDHNGAFFAVPCAE